jgi:hypothetical protein
MCLRSRIIFSRLSDMSGRLQISPRTSKSTPATKTNHTSSSITFIPHFPPINPLAIFCTNNPPIADLIASVFPPPPPPPRSSCRSSYRSSYRSSLRPLSSLLPPSRLASASFPPFLNAATAAAPAAAVPTLNPFSTSFPLSLRHRHASAAPAASAALPAAIILSLAPDEAKVSDHERVRDGGGGPALLPRGAAAGRPSPARGG